MTIADNLGRLHERIAAAAKRARRPAEEIALMAVCKTNPAERIREAYAAGHCLFGENRVQEFAGRWEALRDLTQASWHMIGHLQSNKAARAAELFSAVDSVDSLRLAERLNAAAGQQGKSLEVLLELNLGGEESKSGLAVGSEEMESLLHSAERLEYLRYRGLMTVPPFTPDAEGARPYFRRLRELRDEIAARKLPRVECEVLSMGMSHDFEIAIEEGSTCVRIGTAIFGERPKP